MSKNEFQGERFDFVNELLTGEELLERLAAAQDVVKSLTLKIDLLERFQKNAVNEKRARDKGEAEFYEDMVKLASDLAQAGGYAHKEKNETILAVIHSLLNRRVYVRYVRELDDIPWGDDVPF